MATLVVAPPWLDLGTSRSSGHVSGAGEGQWPVTSCGRTEEVAGGLGLWLEMGMSVWRSVRHIGCLWSAFQASFPATPLAHALINVGGRMYVPYPAL